MHRFACLIPLLLTGLSATAFAQPNGYQRMVLDDQPVAYWSFEGDAKALLQPLSPLEAVTKQPVKLVGKVQTAQPGPGQSVSRMFSNTNQAISFNATAGTLRMSDLGADSPFDFKPGETITLEAWVNPTEMSENQQVYVIGKGRTGNKGFEADNQAWALRLRGVSGRCCVSFLFQGTGKEKGFYRWNSNLGFLPNTGWHHVVVTYTFGEQRDPLAWVDGQPTVGTWDMGKATTTAPVNDDDEIWIGASMGGGGGLFPGSIDEIAVYRHPLSEQSIFLRSLTSPTPPELPEPAPPVNKILVEVIENVPDTKKWNFNPGPATESYFTPAFLLLEVPRKYDRHGVQVDRPGPVMLRATSRMQLRSGDWTVLLRCRNGCRLFIDDKLIGETPFHQIQADAHNEVLDWDKVTAPDLRQRQTGDQEELLTYSSPGGWHTVRLEVYVGGGKKRLELGETGVAFSRDGQKFMLLSPEHHSQDLLSESEWPVIRDEHQRFLRYLNQENRRLAGAGETPYWEQRHELARKYAGPAPEVPAPTPGYPAHNDIDHFINKKLAEAKLQPLPLLEDPAFLRRVSLDTEGVTPYGDDVHDFLADTKANKRARWISGFLHSDRWADHWVPYWQDVLAENPNIVNPTLNNTGPFRWWIHESFLDNKPLDRFATELIRMEGGLYAGGPGGFEMASENDAPMSAKAHIVAQAFLGVDMRCARCHDAPFHDLSQENLFNIAAMLNRKPQPVPKTSTVPLGEGGQASLLIKVNLKPGQQIPPAWPFPEISAEDQLPAGILQNSKDTREKLAALVTSPTNRRFAMVLANRVWKRYLGRGLVEPVDDWEHFEPSHPELLDYLAHELITHDYDLKHLAELILNSHVYQRQPVEELPGATTAFLYPGPIRRRMTAEQLVDSLFKASGQDFQAGQMNIDTDGSRNINQSLNLGVPTRAWMFMSLSNERDRPSLSLPLAQPFVTLMETFGWRSARQDPLTVRDETITVLQPALLANGTIARRVTRLTVGNSFSEWPLHALTVEELVRQIYFDLLGREPDAEELALFSELLSKGYDDRVVHRVPPEQLVPFRAISTGVSWSNHLSPRANEAQIKLQEYVEQGAPPTPLLEPDWRERMEDMLWALVNSPEFVFVP